MNHIGLALDWDNSKIIIAMVISYKPMAITEIIEKDDQIEVKGKILDITTGLYSVVVKSEEPDKN